MKIAQIKEEVKKLFLKLLSFEEEHVKHNQQNAIWHSKPKTVLRDYEKRLFIVQSAKKYLLKNRALYEKPRDTNIDASQEQMESENLL